MRITLNLSPAASARDRYALVWAIPAVVFGLAVLVMLSRASLQEYRNDQVIQSQLTEVQMRAADLHNQEASIRRKLEDQAYRQLLRRAKFVNQLIDERELSLTELSARVAGLLPEDAHLTGLELTSPRKPGDDYALRMGITAKGEDAVETFVNDLEDSPDFKDVAIVNQGFQEESSQGEAVNLVCTARYLPGVEKEVEEKSPEASAGGEEPEVEGQKSEAGRGAPGVKTEKARDKTQEPEVESQKPEAGRGAPGVKTQKARDKTEKPGVESQKSESSRAQE